MKNKKEIFFLKNSIQNYDWGSREFIPKLLGNPPSEIPQAELWMGAHPKAPSLVKTQTGWLPLNELIKFQRESILGKFETFPFLMKVIATEKPLSIQAHPDEKHAIEGYKRENQKGIPLNSSIRNYRDTNSKPELLCALTEFTALKGFRAPKEILELLEKIPIQYLKKEKEALKLKENPIKELFKNIISKRKEPHLKEKIIRELIEVVKKGGFEDSISKTLLLLYEFYPHDIGILSPLFLNIIQLKPYEAIYIAPGELHAYLEGAGIELMSNSDNVIRGGLTSKHVDTAELINILNYEPSITGKLPSKEKIDGHILYQSPDNKLSLGVIFIKDKKFSMENKKRLPQILICTHGNLRLITENGKSYKINKGDSVLIPSAILKYSIEGNGIVFLGMAN